MRGYENHHYLAARRLRTTSGEAVLVDGPLLAPGSCGECNRASSPIAQCL